MIDCDYYQNYRGPDLICAKIWRTGEEKLEITEYIKEYYGYRNDWNGKLYTYDEMTCRDKSFHYKFKVEFLDETGRKHWFPWDGSENPNNFLIITSNIPMNQLL